MATGSDPTGALELRCGWRIIVVAIFGVGLGLSPLPIYSLGVFAKPISEEFGWGRGQVQLMLTFFTIGSLIGTPITGFIIDRIGVRRVVLFATAGFACGMALLGLATSSLFTFYGISMLTALLGAGTGPVAWSRAIFEWFRIRRGLGLGLALTGTGLSAFLIPSYATWVLTQSGWRMGYVGLAILPLLISLPLSYVFLRSPPKLTTPSGRDIPDAGMTLKVAMSGRQFWTTGLSFFLASLGTGGVVTSVVPMLTDRGYDMKTAAMVSGLQGLAVVFGRVITGYLLDRIWAPILAAFIFALPAVACGVLSYGADSVTIFTACVILVGFAGGAEFDMIAYIAGRYFGLRHFGAVYGVLYVIFVSASGFAPAIFGQSYEMTGSYALMLQVAAACFLVGAGLILTLGRYPAEFDPKRT